MKNQSGVFFEIKDRDAGKEDDSLGAISLSPYEILQMNGERKEYSLSSLGCTQEYSRESIKKGGTFVIRCRRIENDEIQCFEMIKKLYNTRQTLPKIGLMTEGPDRCHTTGQNLVSGIVYKNKRIVEGDSSSDKKILYRVRPEPRHPNRHPSYQKWMTKDQIESVVYEESSQWIEGGSGSLGGTVIKINAIV